MHKYHSRRFILHHSVLLIVLLSMVALLATAIDGPLARAATSSFAVKQDFDTGANPRSAVTCDLNGDGKLDLASANLNSNNVSVLLNNTSPGGAASFSAKQDFAVNAGPVSVAVADLNADGKLDLVVANFNANNVSVLLNTTPPGAAAASFADKQDVVTSEGPIFITSGDLNGDGKPDLAVVNLLVNTVSVLLNNTAPGATTVSFAPKQDSFTGAGPVSVALGDLNGDGKLDLAVANFNSSSVTVLLNTTSAGDAISSFSGIQEIATGDGPAFVTMGDLNGDGRLDLAVANFVFNTVSVLLNTTAPGATLASFAANQDFATATGPIFVAAGDVNGDGRLDLAVANFNSDNVSLLLNTTVPGAATSDFAKQDFVAGDAPLSVEVRDLNGDGRLDLAVANLNSSSVSVLLNTTNPGTATPGFAPRQDVDTGPSPRSVTVGDLNGDGKPDLAVANVGSNSVSVLLNTTAPGSAASSFATKQDFETGTNPVSVTVGDLNRDGKLDLAIANINSNTVSVLLNTTQPGANTPSFAAKQEFVTGDGPLSVMVSDLNGDGKLDLITANLISSVSVLLNTTVPGGTTVAFIAKQDFPTGDGPRFVSAGDLNGDGKLDLAVVNFNSGTVAVLLNTTLPGATAVSFSAIHDFPTGVRPISLSIGDLNGDGKLDLAVANALSNTVSVLFNVTLPGATTPSFSPKQDFGTNFNPASITAGDLNGDGTLDLAVANSNSKDVSVLLNKTGPGAPLPSFATKLDFATSDRPVSVARADLNGDGKFDLVVTNFDSNTASVLLNTPTIATAPGLSLQQGSAILNSEIATVTNYGGDGSLSMTITSANPANGVTISNIVNSEGNITADIVASCGASTASFTLQASDGSSTVAATLNVPVTANAAPVLTYQNASVALNGSLFINPATGPADDVKVSSILKQSSGTYTGSFSVDDNTGVISIANAAPAGTHIITIRATDNCGAVSDASFTLTVGKADQTISFGPLANKAIGDADFAVSAMATSGLPVVFVANGQCTLSGNTVHITGIGSCTITASQAGDSNFNPAVDVARSFTIGDSSLITLSESNYNVNESSGLVTITVNRTGDLSVPISVGYFTEDAGSSTVCSTLNSNLASSRCDFGLTLGELRFAAAESQKTFVIPITQDSYTEGPEMFTIELAKLFGSGASFGTPSSATVTISDGANPLPPNANDDTEAFVRQQFRDFLNRDADPAGLEFWTNEIDNCTPKPQCTELRRINASAAFFLSIEFQTTGILVRNFYVAALDRPATNNMPAFEEFERDTQAVQRGVIVGVGDWEQILNNNRDAFMREFVTRAEFIDLYPTTDAPAQYVDKLFRHSGIPPSASERDSAISEFGGATAAADAGARGRALLVVTQQTAFTQREMNRGFVQMQFFGYLRRNPNDAPDRDFAGFDFWVNKLDEAGGNFITSEMVKSFLVSIEYRDRFGP